MPTHQQRDRDRGDANQDDPRPGLRAERAPARRQAHATRGVGADAGNQGPVPDRDRAAGGRRSRAGGEREQGLATLLPQSELQPTSAEEERDGRRDTEDEEETPPSATPASTMPPSGKAASGKAPRKQPERQQPDRLAKNKEVQKKKKEEEKEKDSVG